VLATVDTVTWIYIVVDVAAALALIFLILMHSGKGGGLSDMFGGSVGAAAQAHVSTGERPVLVVPVGNARRCYALVLYGGHEIGTDLDSSERHLLGSLARDAEIAYAQVESDALRRRIAILENELAKTLEPR